MLCLSTKFLSSIIGIHWDKIQNVLTVALFPFTNKKFCSFIFKMNLIPVTMPPQPIVFCFFTSLIYDIWKVALFSRTSFQDNLSFLSAFSAALYEVHQAVIRREVYC